MPHLKQVDVTFENMVHDQTTQSKLKHVSKKDSEDGKKDLEEDTIFALKDQMKIIENEYETLEKAILT
jgi:hypothetical protein